MCCARYSQRSAETFIEEHWHRLVTIWRKSGGRPIGGRSTISQSTISRYLKASQAALLALLISQTDRSTFADDWQETVRRAKAKTVKRREARKSGKGRKIRRAFKRAAKRRPQYALDGKAREGCISALTGRTEIDVTIFCPETRQVLGSITLGDKEGERVAALTMLQHDFKALPSGIITADAGITSAEMTGAVREAGHSYLLAIKGNAGDAFVEALTFDWQGKTDGHQFFEEGHGRQEIRTIRRASIDMFPAGTFSRYADIGCVYEVKAQILRVKDDHYTAETRYFIADSAAARLTPIEALTYIRDHWEQESYHWVKDVVLGEDRCPQKTAPGSRTLAVLRQVVYRIGYTACCSVRRFIDLFSADPAKQLDQLADRLTKLKC